MSLQDAIDLVGMSLDDATAAIESRASRASRDGMLKRAFPGGLDVSKYLADAGTWLGKNPTTRDALIGAGVVGTGMGALDLIRGRRKNRALSSALLGAGLGAAGGAAYSQIPKLLGFAGGSVAGPGEGEAEGTIAGQLGNLASGLGGDFVDGAVSRGGEVLKATGDMAGKAIQKATNAAGGYFGEPKGFLRDVYNTGVGTVDAAAHAPGTLIGGIMGWRGADKLFVRPKATWATMRDSLDPLYADRPDLRSAWNELKDSVTGFSGKDKQRFKLFDRLTKQSTKPKSWAEARVDPDAPRFWQRGPFKPVELPKGALTPAGAAAAAATAERNLNEINSRIVNMESDLIRNSNNATWDHAAYKSRLHELKATRNALELEAIKSRKLADLQKVLPSHAQEIRDAIAKNQFARNPTTGEFVDMRRMGPRAGRVVKSVGGLSGVALGYAVDNALHNSGLSYDNLIGNRIRDMYWGQ